MANPFKAFMDLRKKELPLALLMFSYFFLVITTFWILKPLKKTQFIDLYRATPLDLFGWQLNGAQAEQLAKLLNMAVAFAAVIAFTAAARSLRRQQLTYVFGAFSALCLAIYAVLGGGGGMLEVWSFYLFGDLFNTLMVATFFAFLNDSVTPEAAKRLYGVIVLGGVSGGAFGSLVVRLQIDSLSMPQWMWLCVGITVIVLVLAAAAGQRVAADPPPEVPRPAAETEVKKSNLAVEAAALVFRSRYLLAIVAIVGLYEVVSTILDFQFTATIEEFAVDTGKHFATMYLVTNIFALVVQLFLTSMVMKRFGLGLALLVMPVAILGASGLFLMLPILWIGSSLGTVDNGFNYSLNQSAREVLYTPTTRDEKYKAKAFIDMFVQRSAKALAVGVNLAMTTVIAGFGGVRWLSLVTVAVTVVWIIAARYAGARFHEMTDDSEPEASEVA